MRHLLQLAVNIASHVTADATTLQRHCRKMEKENFKINVGRIGCTSEEEKAKEKKKCKEH